MSAGKSKALPTVKISGRNAPSSMLRCPACGQRLESPLPKLCSLCQYDFGDDRVTGADVTPYAKAYTYHQQGWWPMTKWVWFASTSRLKHLALMRTSAASRKYTRVNIFFLSLFLGLIQWVRVGWSGTIAAIGNESGVATKPFGNGWLHVAAVPRPIPMTRALDLPVDLWWNPAQSVIGMTTGMLLGLILVLLVLMLLRKGVTRALDSSYRHEQRMTAAIQYGTAWNFWILLALIVYCFIPISLIGEMSAWRWYPSANGFILVASILAGIGSTLWWIWLIRLGASAPVHCRGRVVMFYSLATPMLVVTAVYIWRDGQDMLYKFIFPLMELCEKQV